MLIFKSCSVLKDLPFKLLQKIVWQYYFFHIREGRPFKTVKFQRSMSVIKFFFSSLMKNTQPLGAKRNPNPAQQIDLKKNQILERPNSLVDSKEFKLSKKVLEPHRRDLKQKGLGNRPNVAHPLSKMMRRNCGKPSNLAVKPLNPW